MNAQLGTTLWRLRPHVRIAPPAKYPLPPPAHVLTVLQANTRRATPAAVERAARLHVTPTVVMSVRRALTPLLARLRAATVPPANIQASGRVYARAVMWALTRRALVLRAAWSVHTVNGLSRRARLSAPHRLTRPCILPYSRLLNPLSRQRISQRRVHHPTLPSRRNQARDQRNRRPNQLLSRHRSRL